MYLEEQKVAADDLQGQLESNPEYKLRLPNYALEYWAAGPPFKTMAGQRRLHRPHCHASVAH